MPTRQKKKKDVRRLIRRQKEGCRERDGDQENAGFRKEKGATPAWKALCNDGHDPQHKRRVKTENKRLGPR